MSIMNDKVLASEKVVYLGVFQDRSGAAGHVF